MTNEDYEKIFHEIKNNITFISSSLQLIEKGHPEIKSFPYWQDSMQEITALKNMLMELSTARLCNDLTLQKVSPEIFFPELIHSCIKLFKSDNFSFQLELAPCLPEIYIDPHKFKRSLFNLIKNSFEAMDRSGELLFHCCQKDGRLHLDLIDFGGGMAPEYLPNLFTPFETTKPNGTGLGLLIARQIIESHNGSLTVESRANDGCTFHICLPCIETTV